MVSGTVYCFLKASGNSAGVLFHIRFLSARCAFHSLPLARCALHSLPPSFGWAKGNGPPKFSSRRPARMVSGTVYCFLNASGEFGRRPIPHTFSVRAVRNFTCCRHLLGGPKTTAHPNFVPETGTNGLRDDLLLPESVWGIRHIAAQKIPQIIALLSIV